VYCPQSELTQDLLSIVHVFSCRMQDWRKYGKKIKEDPNLPKP
ncbi:MAG: IS607 family transposase, partial [Coleofasciculus sp. E1-EBD-02]